MKKTILAIIVSGFSLGATAETPSFNFVEVGMTKIDADGASTKLDGIEFDFNFELNDDFYLSADYARVKDGGLDATAQNLGLGFKSDITNSTTIFSQVDLANIENDAGFDEDGYRLSVGVRSNFTKKLELNAAYEYLDLGNDSANYYVVGAAYKLTDQFAVYSDYKYESDMEQLSLGVRFNF